MKYCPHAHRCIHPCDLDECFLETLERPEGPFVKLTEEDCDKAEKQFNDYERRD